MAIGDRTEVTFFPYNSSPADRASSGFLLYESGNISFSPRTVERISYGSGQWNGARIRAFSELMANDFLSIYKSGVKIFLKWNDSGTQRELRAMVGYAQVGSDGTGWYCEVYFNTNIYASESLSWDQASTSISFCFHGLYQGQGSPIVGDDGNPGRVPAGFEYIVKQLIITNSHSAADQFYIGIDTDQYPDKAIFWGQTINPYETIVFNTALVLAQTESLVGRSATTNAKISVIASGWKKQVA